MEKFTKFKAALTGFDDISNQLEAALDTLILLDADDFRGAPLQEVARVMKKLQDLHEAFDTSKKRIGVLFDDVRVKYLPAKMDEEDISSFKVDGLGTVSLTDDLRVKVLDHSREFEWLEEIGSGDLISSTVNAQSLKALIRRRLVAGNDVPQDIFDVSTFTRASVTKR
jgi:hypothetical protein